MDKFVQECIINLDLDNLKRLDGTLIQPDVRVALIDDGVDARRQDIEVIKGTSFCEQTGSHFRDFFVAPGGHGTKMAAFIRRICPPVKLYVARLHDYESESGVNRFTARSAVEVSVDQISRCISVTDRFFRLLNGQFSKRYILFP